MQNLGENRLLFNSPATWLLCFLFSLCAPCSAQTDPLQKAAESVHKETGNKFSVHLEERTRWEEHYGNNFGAAKNQQDMLSRIRIGADYQPMKWFSISGMGQDARAPWFGPGATNSVR